MYKRRDGCSPACLLLRRRSNFYFVTYTLAFGKQTFRGLRKVRKGFLSIAWSENRGVRTQNRSLPLSSIFAGGLESCQCCRSERAPPHPAGRGATGDRDIDESCKTESSENRRHRRHCNDEEGSGSATVRQTANKYVNHVPITVTAEFQQCP